MLCQIFFSCQQFSTNVTNKAFYLSLPRRLWISLILIKFIWLYSTLFATINHTELLCDKVSNSWILRFINLLLSGWFFQDCLSPMIKLSLCWIKVKVGYFTSKRHESTWLLLTYQIMISLCDSMLLVLWREERSKICWASQLLLATLDGIC